MIRGTGIPLTCAYAAAIPGARFVVLPETGHMPQLETPDQVIQAIREDLGRDADDPTEATAG